MKLSRLLGMALMVGVPAVIAILAVVLFRQASTQLTLSNEYEFAIED